MSTGVEVKLQGTNASHDGLPELPFLLRHAVVAVTDVGKQPVPYRHKQ
jgi:hypothetical protein